MTNCSAGSAVYYGLLTGCACTNANCKSYCNDSMDYCGGGAPNVTTQICDDCLNSVFGAGQACDTSTGSTIDNQCQANPDCAAYQTCSNGCKCTGSGC